MQRYLWDPTFRGRMVAEIIVSSYTEECCFGVGLLSKTSDQHWASIGSMSLLAELLVWARPEDGTVILCYTRRSLPVRRRRIYNIETARDKERESSERDARTTIE